MATFRSYLTSLEPDIDQTIYSQSIGGYCSNSTVYPETTLVTTIGLYDTSISLNTPSSGGWIEWQGIEYINIGNEMIKVSPITNGEVSVVERGYNGIINMHIARDEVRASSSKQLFNDVFDDNYKQYRCIAIKNDSSLDTDPSGELIAYDFSVYVKKHSRSDDSSIRITLEQPSSQYLSSTSTSWTSTKIVDTSLIDVYNDNYFSGAYLKILNGGGGAAGQGKIVNSFDSSTGTFTFYSSFSTVYNYAIDVVYEILSSPAQRLKTGIVSPNTNNPDILPFVATSSESSLSFTSGNVSSLSVSDLFPNDVIYVWLERTINKGVENFNNNDIVLNINYSVGG